VKRLLVIVFGLLVVVAALAVLSMSYVRLRKHSPSEKDKTPATESGANRGSDGVLHIDSETQKRIGLKTEPLKTLLLEPEVRGYGRILDPAPLATQLTDVETARVAAEAARQELERVKTLQAQNNASVRALQTAEANARKEEIALQAAKNRLALSWGKEISDRDLSRLVGALIAFQSAIVRIDLSPGSTIDSQPVAARVAAWPKHEPWIEAKALGAATTVDPQLQGSGFLFLIETNAFQLRPGATLNAYLRLDGPQTNSIIIPRSAIVRSKGRPFVFVQTAADTFVRREIRLARLVDAGWVPKRGVTAGEKVVVNAAQQLLSEEFKPVE
jgi:hypothetical protein